MPLQVEILVHVAGPSRGLDDARYRKEAYGLLSFEPAKIHPLLIGDDQATGQELDASSGLGPPSSSDIVSTQSGSSHIPQLQAIRECFLKSAADTTPGGVSLTVPSLRTPAPVHLISPVLPWTSIKETPRLLIERTPALPRPKSASSGRDSTKEARQLRRAQSDSWEAPASMIPDSQASQTSQPVQPSTLSQASTGPQTSSPPIPILKRPLSSSFDSLHANDTPSLKRARYRSPTPYPTKPHHKHKSTSPHPSSSPQTSPPLPPPSSQDNIPPSSSPPNDPPLPLEIRPKHPPEVNTLKFTTHMTPQLHKVASLTALQALKIECKLSRPVGDHERGYWQISLSGWTSAAKQDFWAVLTDFIERGKAGMSVWASREMIARPAAPIKNKNGNNHGGDDPVGDHGSGPSGNDKENHPPSNHPPHHNHPHHAEKEEEEVIKIFCFGQVLREIFLLLYIASGNRQKTMHKHTHKHTHNQDQGPKWYDGKHNVVATVSGRYLSF